MEYEIREVRENGSCYVRFTLDDGTTRGQEIQNAPLENTEAFEICLLEHLERIQLGEASVNRLVLAQFQSRLGVKVQLKKKVKDV